MSLEIYPSIPSRVKASLLDSVVLLISAVIIMTLYFYIGIETPIIGVIVFFIFLLYEPILVSWKGRTLGHMFFNFRVVDIKTIDNISLIKAIFRYIVKVVLGIVSLGWAFFTNRQQSLHDLITKSVVISNDTPLDSIKVNGLPAIPYADSQENLILPSKMRRAVFAVIWFFVLVIIITVLYGWLAPPQCLGEKKNSINYCRNIEAFLGYGIVGVLVISLILGSKGRLPGAKRKKELPL